MSNMAEISALFKHSFKDFLTTTILPLIDEVMYIFQINEMSFVFSICNTPPLLLLHKNITLRVTRAE